MEESKQEKLTNAGVDVKSALERFMGNEELFIRFLGKFLQDQNYDSLKAAMEEKRYEDAFKAAHTLKGLCGNLSMMTLFDVVGRQVEFLRNGNYPQAEELMPEVICEYEKTIEMIKSLSS